METGSKGPRFALTRFLLDRFILGELVGPFFFGIMAFTVILVAGTLLFQIADLIIKQGVSLGVVIRLFLYSLPGVITLTIPMSCLLAALLGFGKLSANSEIVALKGAGVSFRRIVRPVVAVSVVIAVFAFITNETLVPLCKKAAQNVMRYEVLTAQVPLFKRQVFFKEHRHGQLERVIYVEEIHPQSGKMSGIIVQEFEDGRLKRIMLAPRGDWQGGNWWVDDGKVFEISEEGNVHLLFRFKRQVMRLTLDPSQVEKTAMNPNEMDLFELYELIKISQMQGSDTAELWTMLHLRISVPWASVILALVGAALGCRPQRSASGVSLGVAIIIVFIYYVIMSFAQSLGDAGSLPPAVAAWTPNVLFFIVGWFLAVRAERFA